jgi:hypothetical protein
MRATTIEPLLACAVLLLPAGCATESPPTEPGVLAARVFRLKGLARWRSDAEQPWQEVKEGMRLAPGAVIETGCEGRADICFGRSQKRMRLVMYEHPSGRIHGHETVYDNMIRLWENSRVRFDRLELGRAEGGTRPTKEVQLDLDAGHVFGSVPKLADGSRYEIKFPGGAARILGAVYDVSVDGVIKVASGSVSVTYLGSQKPQIVARQQMFDVRTGVLCPLPHRGAVSPPAL